MHKPWSSMFRKLWVFFGGKNLWSTIFKVIWEYLFPVMPLVSILAFKIILKDNWGFLYDIVASWCFVIATASIVHIERLYVNAWLTDGKKIDLTFPKIIFYAGIFASFMSLTGGSLMLYLDGELNDEFKRYEITKAQLLANIAYMAIISITYYASHSYIDMD